MTKKTGWIATAVAPIIVGIIVDRLKIVDFSSIFRKAYLWLKSFLAGNLGLSLPIWGWIIVSFAIPAIYFLSRSVYRKIKGNDPYENYKNDNIFGITWSWDYYLQEIIENSLLPLCPSCKFELQPYQASAFDAVNHVGFLCNNCAWKKEFQATHDDVIYSVVKSIEHKIRTK